MKTIKIDWAECPLWANYAVVNGDGSLFLYENEPTFNESKKIWDVESGNIKKVSEPGIYLSKGPDFSKTLTKRPFFYRINWKKLPSWAKYTAIDRDGSLFCFEEKPRFCQATGYWESVHLKARCRYQRIGEAGAFKADSGQYYDSLTKRPEEKERELPSWDKAPEWANWTAQNKDGNWHWFEAEPELYDYRFIPVDFTKHQFALRSENTDGWESSLETKPNEVVVEFLNERPRFESARVGDKVYSLSYGSGVVSGLGSDDDDYPIMVIFDDDKTYADFTIDGKSCLGNANPNLYWSKPTITGGDIPPERMVSIGGYEYPEPERFAPEKETVFYVPVNNGSFSVTAHHKWTGCENQQFLLESGGVHLKRENALQHSEARGLALKDLQGGDSFLINRKVLDALKKSEGVDDDVSNSSN